MVRKGFIYTIVADIYAFCFAFGSILPGVWYQNGLHLAPKHIAFCTKMTCVLHQNDLRFAPKCTSFSTKMQCI